MFANQLLSFQGISYHYCSSPWLCWFSSSAISLHATKQGTGSCIHKWYSTTQTSYHQCPYYQAINLSFCSLNILFPKQPKWGQRHASWAHLHIAVMAKWAILLWHGIGQYQPRNWWNARLGCWLCLPLFFVHSQWHWIPMCAYWLVWPLMRLASWYDSIPFHFRILVFPLQRWLTMMHGTDATLHASTRNRERVQCSIFVKSLLLATPLFGNV